MPKKSKGNKLSRMSDEERARYLQHRADVEEEARRRKRELVARFIKNKLDKEESYNRINNSKLNQVWRFILRRVKCKQLALEIQGAMGSFNFIIDRKDRLISTLMKAIDDSDQQHRRAFQAHTETLSHFLNIGTKRLDKIHEEYDNQKNILLEFWDKDELYITDNQDAAEFKLQLITYIQMNNFKCFFKEKEQERATAKNDARLEHEEHMRSFYVPKQLEIETYWTRLREVYKNFLDIHNPMMDHYQSLREKDDFYQRDIAKNDILIDQISEEVSDLQKQWTKTTNIIDHKLKRMNSHKDDISRKYWQMKRDSKVDEVRAKSLMTLMVDSSQNAVKRFEDMKEKLQKIIHLNEICQKFEKEDDNSNINEEDVENELEAYENLDGAMINECQEYNKLDKFLLKMNRVKVQNLCLKSEKVKLMKENQQLKLYIKKYLTDLALKGVQDRPVSMKVQSSQNIKYKVKRPVTCIEGALSNAVMHERRMQIEKKNQQANQIQSFPRVFFTEFIK